MSERKIVAVGFDFPGGEVESLPLHSNRSLLDADIILFQPGIPYSYKSHEPYNGKSMLTQNGSFAVVQEAAHWRSEIGTALDEGKTVIVYLATPEDVYVYTGEKRYSGTGRSRVTTNIVQPFDSYSAIPFQFRQVLPRSGEVIVPASDLQFLTQYWKEYETRSPFEAYIDGTFSKVLLTTKTGGKIVGAAVQKKGLLLFLPPLRCDDEDFTTYDEQKLRDYWTKQATIFGKQLVANLVALDKAARGGREVTPAPTWAQNSQFRLRTEGGLENKIRKVSEQIEALQTEKAELTIQLEAEGNLRQLLYGQGKGLEAAILDALRLMGFTAEGYKNAESEFDSVFVSPEGRFLGEAEGKDNKAVNIDKFSQLERNLQEDFKRDDVSEYAKGVLFGNAHRLTPLAERGAFFTEKCLSGAKRAKIALVRTPDLFWIAKYLKENAGEDFARQCREAISSTEGECVSFPEIPRGTEETTSLIQVEEKASA
jgi:hypothetical protein